MLTDQKEWQIKLHMLESLSNSQHALARIIQSIADITQASPELSSRIADNIQVLSFYQRVLANRLIPLETRNKQLGSPGTVWLSPKVHPLNRFIK